MKELRGDVKALTEDYQYLERGSLKENVLRGIQRRINTVVGHFKGEGFYEKMNENYRLWIKGLNLSLDYYDALFEKNFEQCKLILDQSLEFVFLQERVSELLTRFTLTCCCGLRPSRSEGSR